MQTPSDKIHERIYQKLLAVIPNLDIHLASGINDGKSELHREGVKDLFFDYLHTDTDGNPIISLAHRYEYNGQMIPDPDMEICLMPDSKQARAVSFQNIYVYEWVREGDSRIQVELDERLDRWLSSCLNLGHKIEVMREAALDREQQNDRTEQLVASRASSQNPSQRSL